MPLSTLATIQQKVRRLTRSPSDAQLSTADIDQYINTFLLYDFPEHLRLFYFRRPFTFWCNAFQDVYELDTSIAVGSPLYDFKNKYITIHPPVYIAGFQSFYSQSREQFFGIYPFVNSINLQASGDGVTTVFTGTVNNQNSSAVPSQQNAPLLQNQVLFSTIGPNSEGLAMVDTPLIDPVTLMPLNLGNLRPPNITAPTVLDPLNFINYITGQFVVSFLNDAGVPTAPQAGAAINSQTVPYVASLPQAMLFYDNQITLRPVPDQPYAVNFEVYARPTELLATNQNPDLNEYWQYISYGAAKKVFEDRMDLDSVQLIMPEFKKQENLVQRRTIVQNTNERTATIYTEQVAYGAGSGWGWGTGGGGF